MIGTRIQRMPHTILWEKNGVVRKFNGSISGEEILESNFDLQAHPKFGNLKYIINDFTSVTEHNIELGHAKAYAASDDIISDTKFELKIAIVVIQEDLIDLAKYYKSQMINMYFNCEIFESEENVRQWIES